MFDGLKLIRGKLPIKSRYPLIMNEIREFLPINQANSFDSHQIRRI